MKILAVDTTSFPASVAIADDNIIIGEYVIRNQRKHSQNIMVMIERLVSDLGLDISDIDLYAVTVGPGSFTGLRIGISTIRALAQAMGKPIVAVGTLEALAYNVSVYKGVVVPMLDARRDEVFTAAYEFCNNTAREITEPCVMTISQIKEKYADKNAVFLGDGAIIHRDELMTMDNAVFAAPNLMETRAHSVAVIAYNNFKNNMSVDYNDVRPVYLRKSQAEREYELKKGAEK